MKKYKNALLFVLALAVIGGLVFLSGGKLRSKAGQQTLSGTSYMGPSDHVSDWSGEDIVIPSGATATIDGSHTFKSVTVQNGGTLTTSAAGAYRKTSRDYDRQAFYDHAWVTVSKGYYKPTVSGNYSFRVNNFDDAGVFRIKVGANTRQASQANLEFRSDPYNWPNVGDSASVALTASSQYEITAVLAQTKVAKSSTPNNTAKLKILASRDGGVFSNINIRNSITSLTSQNPAAMDMNFYVKGSTGIDYRSDFDFTQSGATRLISLPDYRLFDAKAYFPKVQGPSQTGSVWYGSREYDANGYLSTDTNDNEYDEYSINLANGSPPSNTPSTNCVASSCNFDLDFSSGSAPGETGPATYRYVSPIGYLTVDRANTSSADFESNFTGFYTKDALDKMENLPPLTISATTLTIENGGAINLDGRGYLGGRGQAGDFWVKSFIGWPEHALGNDFKYHPAYSGFGLGGGEGYVNGDMDERNDGGGGGFGGRGGWHNSCVASGPCGVAAGQTYGDENAPTVPGSGGAIGNSTLGTSNLWPGGNGGGQIKLNLDTLVLHGSAKITAGGISTSDLTSDSSGYWGGGGSGGSIDISVNNSLQFNNTASGLKPIMAEGAARSATENSIGGGGGRIHMAVPAASMGSVGNYLSVAALYDQLETNEVGKDGTIIIDTSQAAASPVVFKNTYSDSAYTIREATFEAGQTVYVELSVSEPTDSRSDFKIEDMVSTSGSTVTYKFYNSTATDPTSTKTINVSGGKAIFQGSDGITLTHGINKIRYSYKI